MRYRRTYAATIWPILLLAMVVGCGQSGGVQGGSWHGEVTVSGMRRTVRTVQGSVWSGTAQMEEEISIGRERGPESQMLGWVVDLAQDGERVYVLDAQVPALRVYDDGGRHLWDIGERGSGPGEYLQPRSIAVDPALDRLYVRDGSLNRINVYDRQGDLLATWSLNIGMQTNFPMVLTTQGRLYTPVVCGPAGDARLPTFGMAACGPEGLSEEVLRQPVEPADPAVITARKGESSKSAMVPFSPVAVWAMRSDGSMVGSGGSDYRIEVHSPTDSVLVIEKAFKPVPVGPDERAWHRASIEADMRRWLPGWRWNGPPLPDTKPACSHLFCDDTGRVWVVRPGPGRHVPGCDEPATDYIAYQQDPCWIDVPIIEVFDRRGRLLGEVEVPAGMRFEPQPSVRGDRVLATVEGEDGVIRVKRFRLVVPGESEG